MNTVGDGGEPGLLWRADQLIDRLADPDLLIIDVRPGEVYAMGHIPGARHFDIYGIDCDDTDEAPLASFLRMWAGLLGQRGVDFSQTIVFCGHITGSTAARGFWFLELLGHGDVHVLDGGFEGWTRAGLPVTRDAKPAKAKRFVPSLARERLATRHDVMAAIGSPGRVILDTRSAKEWARTGPRGGAVPGSVNMDWRNHLRADGHMKPVDQLRALFVEHGVTPDKEIIAYCRSATRSAHAYLALRILGYPRVRNYLGSWNEWSLHKDLPVAAS